MVDALPPYKRVEGLLADKGTDTRGNYYILVGTEIIGVDWLTFELLMIGEPLRIRATRANQAINIDRLSSLKSRRHCENRSTRPSLP